MVFLMIWKLFNKWVRFQFFPWNEISLLIFQKKVYFWTLFTKFVFSSNSGMKWNQESIELQDNKLWEKRLSWVYLMLIQDYCYSNHEANRGEDRWVFEGERFSVVQASQCGQNFPQSSELTEVKKSFHSKKEASHATIFVLEIFLSFNLPKKKTLILNREVKRNDE
jgi:hypothetical protein